MRHDLLDRIDQRTRLAGHNRLALLLFRLGGRQLFGINVFKVQEVLRRPPLFRLPWLAPQFLGAADVRARSVPVLDLGVSISHPERGRMPEEPGYLIVTEFNRSVQGFLVSAVERIVNIAVEEVAPPPEIGQQTRLTAVARHNGEPIQIIDVERVLAEIADDRLVEQVVGATEAGLPAGHALNVLVVDDSRVACNQIRQVLEQLGVTAAVLSDGRQALEHLRHMAAGGTDPAAHYAMVISDIEMPVMDGYTLTTEIRRDPALAGLFVLLHTSLSGVFNNAMVERVGADAFVAKYSASELSARVVQRLRAVLEAA